MRLFSRSRLARFEAAYSRETDARRHETALPEKTSPAEFDKPVSLAIYRQDLDNMVNNDG